MALVSMKRSPSEVKAETKEMTAPSVNTESFPWGLRINLCEDELSKLDIDITSVTVGDKVKIVAEGKIVEVRQSQTSYNGQKETDERLEIQITALELDNVKESETGKGSEMSFGKKKKSQSIG